MKTVLVCNQKGGVGKTLIADEIAFALDRSGVDYSFYDLDGQGGCIHEQHGSDDAAFCVVDTPGALQSDMLNWMKSADVIIIPTRMTGRDIPPFQTMLGLVRNEDVKAKTIVVLNGWNRFSATRDFEEWFSEEYPSLSTVTVPQSEIFTQAGVAGKSVVEFKPHSMASDQIKLLVGLVKYELGIRQ